MADLTYVRIYTDKTDAVDVLPDESAGQLFKAILHYAQSGEMPQGLEPMVMAMFLMFKPQFDEDLASFRRKCETLRANGSRGGRPRKTQVVAISEKPNGLQENQMVSGKTISAQDKDKDKDKDYDKTIQQVRKAKRFTPPTLDQVRAYCLQRGNHVDAERWFNYYTSNGWRVGRNVMRDWRAAVRTWQRSQTARPVKQSGYNNPFLSEDL